MNRGYTLPELLVAIAAFALVGGAAANLLVSAISAQRQSLAGQDVVNQLSFTAEYMSRAFRQADKELADDPQCLSSRGLSYETLEEGARVRFVPGEGGACQQFFLQGGRLAEDLDGQESFLTSDRIEVTEFFVEVEGEDQADDVQPRITFVIAARNPSAQEFDVRLQASISKRAVDVAN